MKKKFLWVLLAIIITLSGCSHSAQDISNFINWNLDDVYLGEFDKGYIKMLEKGIDEDTLQEIYLERLSYVADYFMAYYSITHVQEKDITRIIELYNTIYLNAKYTVLPAVEDSDGNFSVNITIEPILFFQEIEPIIDEKLQSFEDEFFKEEAEIPEDKEAFYQAYEVAWNDLIISTCEEQLKSVDITHGAPIDITLQIVFDENGSFGISDSDFKYIDMLVIAY